MQKVRKLLKTNAYQMRGTFVSMNRRVTNIAEQGLATLRSSRMSLLLNVKDTVAIDVVNLELQRLIMKYNWKMTGGNDTIVNSPSVRRLKHQMVERGLGQPSGTCVVTAGNFPNESNHI